MAVGIKTPGAGVAVAGTVPLLWGMIRRARPAGPALAVALVGVARGRAWTRRGHDRFWEPHVPLRVSWAAGAPEDMLLHRGELFSPEMVHFDLRRFLSRVFWFNSNRGVQHLNLGPASVLVLAAALLGAMRLRDRAGLRAAGVAMAVVVLLYLLKLTSDDTLVLRTLRTRRGSILDGAVLRGDPCGHTRPHLDLHGLSGRGEPDPGRPWLAPGSRRDRRSTRAHPRLADRHLCGVASSCALAGVIVSDPEPRPPPHRSPDVARRSCDVHISLPSRCACPFAPSSAPRTIRRSTAISAYDPHPTDPAATQAWPIWRALDALPQPARVAFASGWDGRGHHWYRSPLLGAQLQHEVLYISPFPGDTLVDYREDDKVRMRADRAALAAANA